jgi:hypothetical protein
VIKDAVQNDQEYAWSFHCNLAAPMMDACMIDHREANVSAALVMAQLFQVDMTKNKHWTVGYNKSRAQKFYEMRVEAEKDELLLDTEADDTGQAQ